VPYDLYGVRRRRHQNDDVCTRTAKKWIALLNVAARDSRTFCFRFRHRGNCVTICDYDEDEHKESTKYGTMLEWLLTTLMLSVAVENLKYLEIKLLQNYFVLYELHMSAENRIWPAFIGVRCSSRSIIACPLGTVVWRLQKRRVYESKNLET
jgi:hypothetical protein